MGLRVLIVDDNRSFLEAARGFLAREGVHVIGLASTGAEALRLTDELRPDVVLVDIVLADESGFALARRLAEHDPDGPAVILVSTHAEEDFSELVEESEAIGFLPKGELSADVIRRMLDLTRAAGATARPGR
jgi:DNA-binding NarL/FixJ family response regulator